jgi:hypothetical protein
MISRRAIAIIIRLNMTLVFFLLCPVYQRTGNSLGPMIAWSLMNGQVCYLAQLLRP